MQALVDLILKLSNVIITQSKRVYELQYEISNLTTVLKQWRL